MAGIQKKFLFQLLYAFSQLAFPLITYPYITRRVGAEGLGLVGYVEYLSGFIITLAAFGIPLYGTREIARLQNNPDKKQQVFRQLFSFHLLVSILGCGVFLLVANFSHGPGISTEMLWLGCLNILLPAFIAEWYLQGDEAFVFIATRSILLRIAGLAAFFLFVHKPEDYITYFLVIVLVQGMVAITNMVRIGLPNFLPLLHIPIIQFRTLWRFFLSSSLISIYVFFDVIILGWVADENHVGYYTIAVRIVKLSLLLVLSLNIVLFPRVSFLKSSNDGDRDATRLTEKAAQFILLLTTPLAIGFFLLSPQLIALLAGPTFAPSANVVRLLCLLPLVIGFSNLFVFQILLPHGKEQQLLKCVLLTCGCSFLLHIFLAPRWLENGTAVATLFTEIIMTALTAWFSSKAVNFRFPSSMFWQSLVATLPLILFFFLSSTVVNDSFIVLTVSGLCGGLAYLLIQLCLFKNVLLAQGWALVKQAAWRMKNG